MKRIAPTLLATLLVVAVLQVNAANDTPSSESHFGFGMDASAAKLQTDAGVKPDYGTFWVGPWTLTSGWGGPNKQLDDLRAQGVTPAIHYYYWGDDISPTCVENGCWSSLHSAWKDKAGWQQLADELVVALNTRMKGDPVVIFIETEFNKGGIESYKPFDGYLREKAQHLKEGYPNAQIVIPFGNWNSAAWPNFSGAVAASDYAGIQGMRGSTRHSETQYLTVYEVTLDGIEKMKKMFGKPVFITDIALSSYPEPAYLEHQAAALAKFFTNIDALQAAGANALIYRAWHDDPKKNTANWFGEAERHWGLVHPADGTHKPAAQIWVDGVKRVRTADTAPAPEEPKSGFIAAFNVSPNVNEWWVEVRVDASAPPARVHASIDDGSWLDLPKTDWGSWARSTYTPEGSKVIFRATDAHGQTVHSKAYTWLQAETEPEQAPSLDATGERIKGRHVVDLQWAGLAGDTVTIQRDGHVVATTANDGAHRDEPGGRGGGSYTYTVCQTTGSCTPAKTVVF